MPTLIKIFYLSESAFSAYYTMLRCVCNLVGKADRLRLEGGVAALPLFVLITFVE